MYFLRVLGTYFTPIQFQAESCRICIICVVAGRQVDKRKDYMSLEVVPEDDGKETAVVEEDERTKVKHFFFNSSMQVLM